MQDIFIYCKQAKWYSEQFRRPLLPLCLARYRPRTIIKHKVMKTTTATTPPIKAWSGPCCPKALGSETQQIERGDEKKWRNDNLTTGSFYCQCSCRCLLNSIKGILLQITWKKSRCCFYTCEQSTRVADELLSDLEQPETTALKYLNSC